MFVADSSVFDTPGPVAKARSDMAQDWNAFPAAPLLGQRNEEISPVSLHE
jgi:hypothetical protein